jgi:WD40 repeat protein
VFAHILVSGSWDTDIRVWDVSNSSCLQTVGGHVADVYGITSIMSYPMLFVSTSRDNTMRIWSMENLISELKWKVLKALAIRKFEEAANLLFVDAKDADVLSSDFRMSGPIAIHLRDVILDPTVPCVTKWKATMELLSVSLIRF